MGMHERLWHVLITTVLDIDTMHVISMFKHAQLPHTPHKDTHETTFFCTLVLAAKAYHSLISTAVLLITSSTLADLLCTLSKDTIHGAKVASLPVWLLLSRLNRPQVSKLNRCNLSLPDCCCNLFHSDSSVGGVSTWYIRLFYHVVPHHVVQYPVDVWFDTVVNCWRR